MRAALLLSIPAVSAMINWSPKGLHLPASLTSLLYPTSNLDDNINNALPTAAAIIGSQEQDADEFVVVINPAISALLPAYRDAESEKDSSSSSDTKIEDARIDFVSPYLPPPPTRARGDVDAPISSHTAFPGLDNGPISVIVDVVDETDFPAGDAITVTASDASSTITLLSEYGFADANIDTSSTEHAGEEESKLRKQLDCLRKKMQALHRQSTTYLIPTTAFQWMIFALSFGVTLLVIGGKVMLAQRRRRNAALEAQSKELTWEKLNVAGIEVGMVKRRTLRRGECVWVVVTGEDGAGERMEKVWLEDGVGVRGKEVWDRSMV